MQFESINGLSVCQLGNSQAPAVLLLHGHSQTGLMWMDTASQLAENGFRALALHLPGIGESATSPEGHRKTNVATHIRTCLKPVLGDKQPISLVGHDLGAMVAYAYAAQFPDEIAGLAMLETPIAGLPPWDETLRMPQTWHFGFTGEHCEALVKGREDIYLARFWQEMSSRPGAISSEAREAYVKTYSRDGVMRNSFDYDVRSNVVGAIDISTLTQSPQRKVVMMQFDRPVVEVFSFLLEEVDVYSDDIMEVQFDNSASLSPDGIGQGSVRICTMKKGKQLFEPLMVYKENEFYAYTTDPDRSTMKLPIRDVLLFYTFEEKTPNSTLVTVRAHFNPDVFLLMRPVVNTVFNRNVVKTFAGAIEQLGGRFVNL